MNFRQFHKLSKLSCYLVLAVLPLSLSRPAGANTRDDVFVLLRSGFWWDDRDGVQIQTHASC